MFDLFKVLRGLPTTPEEIDDAVSLLEDANRLLLATVATNEATIAALKMHRTALGFFLPWVK